MPTPIISHDPEAKRMTARGLGENPSYTALTSPTTYRLIGIGKLRSKPTRHQSTRHRRVCCMEPPGPGASSMSASIRGRLLPPVADDAFRVVCGDWRRLGTQPSRPGTSVTIAPAAMIATTITAIVASTRKIGPLAASARRLLRLARARMKPSGTR